LRAQLRRTRCYVALLAAHTGPLNSLCSLPRLPELPGGLMANLIRHLLESPTREEALCIGALPYEANVVAGNVEQKFAFPEIKLSDFLRDPRQLSREFGATAWRSAYYENQQSLALRFVLRSTQKYFWPADGYAAKARNLARRAARKLKKLT
jgi:hypothetical protein